METVHSIWPYHLLWIGGLVGYQITLLRQQSALIFNAVFMGLLGISVIVYFIKQENLSFYEAVLGVGKAGIRFKKISVNRTQTEDNGEEVSESVPSAELMAMYDEILEREGKVDQDALMSMLASQDLEVRKHRRSLLGIIYTKFSDDREGDWTLRREDWENLVKRSENPSLPPQPPPSAHSNKSRAKSSIAALRRASIAQIESMGYRRVEI